MQSRGGDTSHIVYCKLTFSPPVRRLPTAAALRTMSYSREQVAGDVRTPSSTQVRMLLRRSRALTSLRIATEGGRNLAQHTEEPASSRTRKFDTAPRRELEELKSQAQTWTEG